MFLPNSYTALTRTMYPWMHKLSTFRQMHFHLLLLIISISGSTFHFISPTAILAADITGSNRDDVLYGTVNDDKIYGQGGKDTLNGGGGNDVIRGGSDDDFIVGDLGNDNLEGNNGNDIIQGAAGADKISGGSGNDVLMASFVTGSTSIRDYATDTIECGFGVDTAFINPADGDSATADCEIVIASP